MIGLAPHFLIAITCGLAASSTYGAFARRTVGEWASAALGFAVGLGTFLAVLTFTAILALFFGVNT